MGRARLTMELIGNEKSRNSTFQKRKRGLKKKMYEFTTLCGVDACMVVYGPSQDDRPMELDTWPSNPIEVRRIINRYKSKVEEHGKRNIDLSDFFEDRKKKIDDEIVKVRRNNTEAKYTTWDDRINYLSLNQLGELLVSFDRKLEVVKTWIELVKGSRRLMKEVAHGMIGYSHTQSIQSNSYYTQDLFQTQGAHSSMKPLDNHVPIQYYPSDQGRQMLHFDLNPKAINPSMMMMMNDNDCTQFGGASSSNIQYTTLQAPLYYDPTSGMLENMVYNNNPRTSMSYCSTSMQPYVQRPVMSSALQMHGRPVMSSASQMHGRPAMSSASQMLGPQVNNYCDFNEFQMMNKRGRY